MIDYSKVRSTSQVIAEELGYPVNPNLPLLDSTSVGKSCEEVVNRILAMHTVASCAYGCDRKFAENWLWREGGSDSLTLGERDFLLTGNGNRNLYMCAIEGIWALAWCVGIVFSMDFSRACSNKFIHLLPDLKNNGSALEFRNRSVLRPFQELSQQCDLAYCLHWGLVQAKLEKSTQSRSVADYIIIERRHALEWILSTDNWDDVVLDT